jgi:hypothetical protein
MDKSAHPKFKPCDALTAEDFEAHSIWGFDVSREARVDGADETWVRPYDYRSVPRTSDVLFAAAQVKAGSNPPHQGALAFRYFQEKVRLDGCVLLVPRYCTVSLQLKESERSYLRWALGDKFPSYFPITYAAVIELGKERFPVSGTLVLPDGLKRSDNDNSR